MGWQDAPVVSGTPAKGGWQSAPVVQPQAPSSQPWYGEEKGIAAKLLDAGKNLVTGIDDVMSGGVDPKSDEGIGKITDAALVANPVSAGTRGGLGWSGRPLAKKAAVATPGGTELLGAGEFGFRLSREMGVDYSARAVQNTMWKTRSQLFTDGVIEELAPKSFAILKRLESPPEGGVATIAGLHAARRQLGKAAQDFTNPTEQEAAVAIIKAIDDFVTNPDPESVVAGDAAAAGAIWRDAMDNYAAGKRSEGLVDNPRSLEERSERRLNPLSTTSADKSIRDRVGALLDDPKKVSGFSQGEIADLEAVKNGTATRNVISRVGALLGPGAGLSTTLAGASTGLWVGGPAGAAVGAVPGVAIMGARGLGGTLTKGALNRAAEKVRQRSPVYEERLATAPAPPPLSSPGTRSMMGRTVGGVLPAARPPGPLPQMTKEQWNEYLKQKWAAQQGA